MTTRVAVSVNGEGSTPEGESFTASCALTFDDEPSSIQGADAIENCVGCIIGACRRIVAEELMKEEHGLWYEQEVARIARETDQDADELSSL